MFTCYDAAKVAEFEAQGVRICSEPQSAVVRGRSGFGVFVGSKMVAWAPDRWSAGLKAFSKGYRTLTQARMERSQQQA